MRVSEIPSYQLTGREHNSAVMMKTVIDHNQGRHHIEFYTVENEAVRDRLAVVTMV